MSEQSTPQVVRLGDTLRLTHKRPDGGRVEMTLTRGAQRSNSVYAVIDPDGRLHVVSARSWPNTAEEKPELARRMEAALTQSSA